jgi:hypothetical protein
MNTSKLKKTGAAILLFVMVTSSNLIAAENWEKIESKSGITIYERWVNVSNNVFVKERKGEMVITGTMNSVLNTLNDPSKTKIWMENVSDAYLINKESEKEWSSYTYFSLPWPIENRDMVAVSKLIYNNPKYATIEMVSKENALPLKKSVKRLIDYKATWKIADIGNGHIFVSLSAISKTPPEFPRFIMDPIVRGAFLRNLLKLKVIISI